MAGTSKTTGGKATSAAKTKGSAADGAANGAAANGGGALGKKRVIFTVEAPDAKEVYLCGTFNGWDSRTPMKSDGNGAWKATVMLPPGTYEYRLKVDGEWIDDPGAQIRVANPFGTMNCVRHV